MAVVQTGTWSNSIQGQLLTADYIMAMRKNYIYSQAPLAYSPPQAVIAAGNRASSIAIPVHFELVPAVTAISQTADVTPVTVPDAIVSVSADMYGNVVQLAQKLEITATPDVRRIAAEQIARNAAESIDYLARTQAIAAPAQVLGGDATARSALSAASSTDEIRYANFVDAKVFLDGARAPKIGGAMAGYACIVHPAVSADVLEDGTVILLAEYQKADMLLNGEIGTHMAGVRLIESNNAKVYHGSGSSIGAAFPTTNLSTACSPGDTAIYINTGNASAVVGYYFSVGTQESSTAGEQKDTETVLLSGLNSSAAASASTLQIVGGGANGGLLYAHASGVALYNNYQVHATVFMGAESLIKVYTTDEGMGPDGIVYPPERTGLLKQWQSFGWKVYTGFGRVAGNRIFVVEHAASRQFIGR